MVSAVEYNNLIKNLGITAVNKYQRRTDEEKNTRIAKNEEDILKAESCPIKEPIYLNEQRNFDSLGAYNLGILCKGRCGNPSCPHIDIRNLRNSAANFAKLSACR